MSSGQINFLIMPDFQILLQIANWNNTCTFWTFWGRNETDGDSRRRHATPDKVIFFWLMHDFSELMGW